MLKVIGAGFGRTGTLSLKRALEMLGYGPCYHMLEVLNHPQHDQLWLEAIRGSDPKWPAVFRDFQATVDWPSSFFWRELSLAYPEAKIILTLRDEDEWYESVRETIFATLERFDDQDGSGFSEHRLMTRELIFKHVFGDRFDDADHVRSVYRANNENVRASISKDRLLVYKPGDGWGPAVSFFRYQ